MNGRMEVRKKAKEERDKEKRVPTRGNKIWVEENSWILGKREMGFVQAMRDEKGCGKKGKRGK